MVEKGSFQNARAAEETCQREAAKPFLLNTEFVASSFLITLVVTSTGLGTTLPTIFAARALDGFFCGNMGVPWRCIGDCEADLVPD